MAEGRGGIRTLAGKVWGEAKGPLYRNAIFIMLSSVIGSGLGLFWWYSVSSFYSDEDIGYGLALAQTIGFLAAIANLGLSVGIVRFLPESDDRPALVNSALSVAGLAGGLLALGFAVLTPWLAPELSFVVHPVYLVAIVLTGMAYAFAPVLDFTAIALRRADLPTWRNAVFGLVKIPLPVLFALALSAALGGRMGVYLSIAAAFGASVVIMGYGMLPRILHEFLPRPRLSRRRIRPLFRFSVGNWMAGIFGSAGVLLLPLLVLRTTGRPESTTHFYAAYTLAGLLFVVPGAIMTSLLAEASQRGAQRQRDERRAVLLSLGLLAPGIAGMWFLARPLLEIFVSGTGEAEIVEAATTPLRILAFASIPVFLGGLFATRIRIRKRVLPLIAGAAVASGVTLGAGYVLLGSVGLEGLAYAFVAGQTAQVPVLWASARGPIEAAPIELAPTPPS